MNYNAIISGVFTLYVDSGLARGHMNRLRDKIKQKKKLQKAGVKGFQHNVVQEFQDLINNDSQGYIAHTATRALIYIRADNPKIGLMCVIPIGIAEVSSCIIDKKIKPGYKIEKGEELGYFQFGGSTHCLVFRKDVIKKFTVKVNDDIKMGQHIANTR